MLPWQNGGKGAAWLIAPSLRSLRLGARRIPHAADATKRVPPLFLESLASHVSSLLLGCGFVIIFISKLSERIKVMHKFGKLEDGSWICQLTAEEVGSLQRRDAHVGTIRLNVGE